MKITTLIPAYRATHLNDVFRSLAFQSSKQFSVIVSDDSPDESVSAWMADNQAALNGHVKIEGVIRGPQDEIGNHAVLIEAWNQSTPYYHFMHDDDAILPEFYSAHLQAHARHPNLSVTCSLRWMCDPQLRPHHAMTVPEKIAASTDSEMEIDQKGYYDLVIAPIRNWIGEPSFSVFSRSHAGGIPLPIAGGSPLFGLTDVGMMLSSLGNAPMCLIKNHLGLYRIPGPRASGSSPGLVQVVGHVAWFAYLAHGLRCGMLSHSQLDEGLGKVLKLCTHALGAHQPDFMRLKNLAEAFLPDRADEFSAHVMNYWSAKQLEIASMPVWQKFVMR